MKNLFLILFIVVCGASNAQPYHIKYSKTTPLHADFFIGTDDFDNIYFIKDNNLFKRSEQETLNYTNVSLGKITSVDIQNPFKIILFYADYNSVIILDNKLNPLTNKIDLTKESLFNNVILVSSSSENNIWLFADDNKMHLYDYQNHFEIIQTQALTFYHDNFKPISLKSNYKNALLVANTGVFQINQYGNFVNFFDLEKIDFISPFKNGFIFLKDKIFYFFNGDESFIISTKINHVVKNIHINKSSITIFDGVKIYHYSIF